jgi:hypothetical protein
MPRAEDPLEELTAMLGAPPPAGLLALDAAVLADLAVAVRDVRARQSAALRASSEKSLKQIPLPLRGVVRKVLGG